LRSSRGRSTDANPRSSSSGRWPRIRRGERRESADRSDAVQPDWRVRSTRSVRSAGGSGARIGPIVSTIRACGNTRRTARLDGPRSLGSPTAMLTRRPVKRWPAVPIDPARTRRELTGSRSSASARGTTINGTGRRPSRRRSRFTARPPESVSRETTSAPTSGSMERPNRSSSGTTRNRRPGKLLRTHRVSAARRMANGWIRDPSGLGWSAINRSVVSPIATVSPTRNAVATRAWWPM